MRERRRAQGVIQRADARWLGPLPSHRFAMLAGDDTRFCFRPWRLRRSLCAENSEWYAGEREKWNRPVHVVEIKLNGEVVALDASGALYWPSEKALVFADLHFEKASSFARRGTFLPPYDTRATIARMRGVVDRFMPSLIIALGDSFHDREGADRLGQYELEQLRSLSSGREWIWVVGNHDPDVPRWLGGSVVKEVALSGLSLRHEPEGSAARGEIAGHFHPCATAVWRGRGLRRPCFVSDGERMILPAFGAFTGGLDVDEPPITSLFPRGFISYLLGARRVYAIGSSRESHKLWRKNNDDSQPRNSAIATADAP